MYFGGGRGAYGTESLSAFAQYSASNKEEHQKAATLNCKIKNQDLCLDHGPSFKFAEIKHCPRLSGLEARFERAPFPTLEKRQSFPQLKPGPLPENAKNRY